jgi:hypothetical protein
VQTKQSNYILQTVEIAGSTVTYLNLIGICYLKYYLCLKIYKADFQIGVHFIFWHCQGLNLQFLFCIFLIQKIVSEADFNSSKLPK